MVDSIAPDSTADFQDLLGYGSAPDTGCVAVPWWIPGRDAAGRALPLQGSFGWGFGYGLDWSWALSPLIAFPFTYAEAPKLCPARSGTAVGT